MRKLLLLLIAVVAMIGTSNAQTAICDGDPAPPGGCGYYDNLGLWVFTKCIPVACATDPNNCGAVGNKCDDWMICANSTCVPPLISKARPFRPQLKHDGVTRALALLVRKE